MKRILSSLGVGSAEVDLILPSESLTQGETVDAEVEVIGGNAEQDVDEIYYAILTQYSSGAGRETGVIAEGKLVDGFTIEPADERTIDVELTIPLWTPVTMGSSKVWIETALDIDWAVDPDDRDDIQVKADERTTDLLEAMEAIGFTFREAENVADEHGQLTTQRHFVQEFEFKPRTSEYAQQLDEVEVIALPTENEVEFVIEVDRKGSTVEEMTGGDEATATITFSSVDAEEELAEKLREAIDRQL
jgi:sporulation-control protein